MKAPKSVLDIIEFGYKIPFLDGKLPPLSHLDNNKSALQDTDFIESQLYMFEKLGCIRKVNSKPRIILPLSSVLSNKKRLIVDGSRKLNPFIVDRKVRLSHLAVANQNLKQNHFMATCDLESGYYQVPIHPDHQELLGIAWTKNGKTVYFV